MMNLQDALFNWLQISLVAAARPEDGAAAETRDFFAEILTEDHKLSGFRYELEPEAERYQVDYELDGQPQVKRFDRELADQLLVDINSNPKYNE